MNLQRPLDRRRCRLLSERKRLTRTAKAGCSGIFTSVGWKSNS